MINILRTPMEKKIDNKKEQMGNFSTDENTKKKKENVRNSEILKQKGRMPLMVSIVDYIWLSKQSMNLKKGNGNPQIQKKNNEKNSIPKNCGTISKGVAYI